MGQRAQYSVNSSMANSACCVGISAAGGLLWIKGHLPWRKPCSHNGQCGFCKLNCWSKSVFPVLVDQPLVLVDVSAANPASFWIQSAQPPPCLLLSHPLLSACSVPPLCCPAQTTPSPARTTPSASSINNWYVIPKCFTALLRQQA